MTKKRLREGFWEGNREGIREGLGNDSGKDLEEDPEMNSGKDLGKDSGKDIGKEKGKDSGNDLGKDLEMDQGKNSGKDIGEDSGKDSGNDSGKVSGWRTQPLVNSSLVPFVVPDIDHSLSSPISGVFSRSGSLPDHREHAREKLIMIYNKSHGRAQALGAGSWVPKVISAEYMLRR